MRNTLVRVMEKSTHTCIQLWAHDVNRLLLGYILSKMRPFEVKCGTQMPVAPPSLTDQLATLLNQREQNKSGNTQHPRSHRVAKAWGSPAEQTI